MVVLKLHLQGLLGKKSLKSLPRGERVLMKVSKTKLDLLQL